jgi:hypothetical protein
MKIHFDKRMIYTCRFRTRTVGGPELLNADGTLVRSTAILPTSLVASLIACSSCCHDDLQYSLKLCFYWFLAANNVQHWLFRTVLYQHPRKCAQNINVPWSDPWNIWTAKPVPHTLYFPTMFYFIFWLLLSAQLYLL